MYFQKIGYAMALAMGLQMAAGSPTVDLVVRTHDAPGSAAPDTMRAFRRALSEASVYKRDTVLQNTTSLEKSWDGAVLLSL